MFRRYLVPFKAHRLPHVLTDALIIGGGVAGLRAAHEAAKFGDVLLVTKGDLKESNTYFAQGGIASVTTKEDSFESHIQDTMTVACGLGNRAAVETVVRGPRRDEELIEWGRILAGRSMSSLAIDGQRRVVIRYTRIIFACATDVRRGASWRIA